MASVNGEQLDLISLESEGRSLNQPPYKALVQLVE